MKRRPVLWATTILILAGNLPTVWGQGEEKVHAVGKDGLTLEGKVAQDDPKVKVIDGDKSGQLPAKLFQVKLAGGKKYRIAMNSQEIDSVLVVQDQTGRQLAWDDDSGGGLNSLLTLDVPKDGTYKVYAASLKGSGPFTLKLTQDGAIKVHEVGAGLKIEGELGKTSALIYNVKLEAGKSYVIDMMSPNPKTLDPFLRLLDPQGKKLAEDDDSGGNLNARIVFRADIAATYQVVATCFGKGRGPFTLTVREAQKGEREQGTIASLLAAARKHEDKEDFPAARQAYQEALAIQHELHGKDDWRVTDTRRALADVELTVKLPAEDRAALKEASRLNNQVFRLWKSGKSTEALPLAQRALAIRQRILGPAHPLIAQSFFNMAAQFRRLEQTSNAEALYHQALKMRKDTLGERHPYYESTVRELAILYQSRGEHAKAEPLFQEALEITRQIWGEGHRDYGASLNNVALHYVEWGEYAKAEVLFRKALDAYRHALGDRDPAYISSLNNLARLYRVRGELAKAETLYQKVLELRKHVLGERHSDYANTLNSLGLVYRARKEYGKAERFIQKALELRKEILGESHPDYAVNLDSLAGVYFERGEYAKAEPLVRQALDLTRQVRGEAHPYNASYLKKLAMVYYAWGKYAKAEPIFQQALELVKHELGERHPHYAIGLHDLAELHSARGDFARAEPLFEQALVAVQEPGQDAQTPHQASPANLRADPAAVRIVHGRAAVMRFRLGKQPPAEQARACDRAYELAIGLLDRVRRESLEEEESKVHLGADHFDLFPERLDVLRSLYDQERRPADLVAAFATAEQGTARAFLESLGKARGRILGGVDRQLQEDESRLLRALRELDGRIEKESARAMNRPASDLVAKLFGRRRATETELNRLLVRMAKEYPQYANLKYPRPCSLEEARSCLDKNEAALLFVPGPKGTFVVVVGSTSAPGPGLSIHPLPGAKALAERIDALSDTESLTSIARSRALGAEAYQQLLAPLADKLKGKDLVIVPNGPLCHLPFELLVEPDGKFLIENRHVRYAPSLTVQHLARQWDQKRLRPDRLLWALGDPLYDTADQRLTGKTEIASASRDALLEYRSRDDLRFGRLKFSGDEVQRLRDLLGPKDVALLTGAQATEANVKAASQSGELARYRYLHFAAHGILGLDKGRQPALVLNLVGNDTEDGFLQLDEVTNLKMNADLVVLSACKTAQGRLHNGEGVRGLARAFLYAGSRGVVCSLWSVDDRQTSRLMTSMYRHLRDGRPAAEALRAAQVAMIREGQPPLYWAPFILIGE